MERDRSHPADGDDRRLGAVGLDAVMVRRASDAADEGAGGADTVSVGIELSPLATHQAPETTTQ